MRILVSVFLLAGFAAPLPAASRLQLREAWSLQSSRKVTDRGEIISSTTFRPTGWYSTKVPATVVAAQVAAGEFPDPYVGMNLRKFPGMTYPIGLNSFSNLPMDKDSPYACSWWYRTEFQVPRGHAGRSMWLHFEGINYRANIWLNGRSLAASNDVQGAYRIYEFDVTCFLRPGEPNALALEVFAPTEKELGINWVDWAPTPPDKSMGVWGNVYLTTTGTVSVRHPQVITHFPDRSLKRADLTVMSQLHNASAKTVRGVVEAVVDRVTIRQDVTLQPNESRSISLGSDQFPELKVLNPKLWWPVEMGTPHLHDLTLRFLEGGSPSDEQRVRFGIREVTSELTGQGYRVFLVNGRRILIRGAGWAQDLMLRPSRARLEAQIRYVLDMGLNTIRLEAMLEDDRFFDLCDEQGILVMAGWCCCDIWERWEDWGPGTLHVATEQLRTQILRMRSHPCMFVWLNGSDGPPPAAVESAYCQTLKEVAWPNPIINSAAEAASTVTGPSGVKMTGPYDYEPPSYWLTDHDRKWGGAFGFNTETGPGPAIPPLESLKKMLPPEHLWPVDQYWQYHSAGERFQTMERYHEAMNRTYGTPTGLQDYLRKSQAMAYDGERAMFEAYARNKYTSTGVIQWMLNNPWPSTYWHLYDYFLYPAGGYFGTKKACEPVHAQYSYDDRSVFIVSTRRQPVRGLTVSARLFDFRLKELFSREVNADVESDAARRVVSIPPFPAEPASTTYFLKLSVRDAAGKEISSNFYWLPGGAFQAGLGQDSRHRFHPHRQLRGPDGAQHAAPGQARGLGGFGKRRRRRPGACEHTQSERQARLPGAPRALRGEFRGGDPARAVAGQLHFAAAGRIPDRDGSLSEAGATRQGRHPGGLRLEYRTAQGCARLSLKQRGVCVTWIDTCVIWAYSLFHGKDQEGTGHARTGRVRRADPDRAQAGHKARGNRARVRQAVCVPPRSRPRQARGARRAVRTPAHAGAGRLFRLGAGIWWSQEEKQENGPLTRSSWTPTY